MDGAFFVPPHTNLSKSTGSIEAWLVMLAKVCFDESRLDFVSNFDCGHDPWEVEVSNWLKASKGTSGALSDIADLETKVWIYLDESNHEIVGIGSLGTHTIRYQDPKKGKMTDTFVIPGIALSKKYWGQPKAGGEKKYSHQIMEDIIEEAKFAGKRNHIELIMLVVHQENTRCHSPI